MPILGRKEKISEEGESKEGFVVTFTNGALDQLNDFSNFYNKNDLTEVIKLAVSFLQQIKELKEKEIEDLKIKS